MPPGFDRVFWPVLGITLVCIVAFLIINFRLQGEVKVAVSDVLQFVSIISGALVITLGDFFQANESAQASRRRTYQELELAAIDFFRFEIDHPDLIKLVWIDDSGGASNADPVGSESESSQMVEWDGIERANAISALTPLQEFMVGEYLAQILCLFELAVKYREEDIMPPEVSVNVKLVVAWTHAAIGIL